MLQQGVRHILVIAAAVYTLLIGFSKLLVPPPSEPAWIGWSWVVVGLTASVTAIFVLRRAEQRPTGE
jgi:hypothetical protein